MMGNSEIDNLLLLAANGLEHVAKERLRAMSSEEWRTLCQACVRLDEWLDDIALERRQRGRKVSQ